MHLLEYALYNSSKTFKSIPFNEVDALLFAQISYYDYSVFEDGISFKEIQKHPNVIKATKLENLIGDIDEKLFNIIIASKRYGDVIVKWHESEMDPQKAMQFSATTFILPNDITVVSFRGTDGTVIGWHEDMNMTYMFPIPGQSRAQAYINNVLSNSHTKKVVVVGHSKGGNLATFAGIMAKDKYLDRIKAIYNFDGPGFNDTFYDLEAFNKMKNKYYKFIPPQSSIGRMLKDVDRNKVIKSDAKYMMQHWAHTWLIEDNHFAYADGVDFFSESVGYSTDAVIQNMTKEERKEAVTLMFDILAKTNCNRMEEVFSNKEKVFFCLKEYSALKDRRSNINKFALELFKPFIKLYADRGYMAAKDVIKEKKDLLVDKFKTIWRKD